MIASDYNSNDFDINKTDMRIVYKINGNEILFAGLDDVEKLKSIYNSTCIWIEEASEIDADDYRQLDIRLRGQTKQYKQIIFSFNPVSITHWLKSEFFDIAKEDTTTSHTTYLDNKFLDDEAIKVLEGFKTTDPYYYAVYCKGEWGVLGKTVFDGEKVTNRIIELRTQKIGEKGRFERDAGNKVKFIADVNGEWTVFHHPTQKQKFVAGVDVAEGNIWGDYNTTQILDTVKYEQCCVYRGHCDLDMYAEELCKVGEYYNNALLVPEVNFTPGLVLNLQRLKYPRIYLRQTTDSITHQIQMKYGFRTDKYNRQAIISDLVEFVRDHVELINDIKTLEEMLTFVRDDKGKPQAQEGKHDDLVMALAIALHGIISGQGGTYIDDTKADLSKLPQDCQEDYYNATEQQKRILEKKWGLL
jgi:phage terminase large subunit